MRFFASSTVLATLVAAVAGAEGSGPDPVINASTIGTFNLSAVYNTSSPGLSAFFTRNEPEWLYNRTKQARHGSSFRHLTKGAPLEVSGTVNGTLETTDSFMKKFGIAGLIVVKDGAVRIEKYQYGNQPNSFNVVQSCTKSFISTAIGVAIAQGKISLSDVVSHWIPELAPSPFANVTLRDISDMASGVAEPENATDLFQVYKNPDPDAVFDLLNTYERVAAPATVYNYMDQCYFILSVALSRAVNETVQSFITKHIWDPAGMQYDGLLRANAAGQVDGHGGLGITLGDMARFALFVLDSIHGVGGPKVPAGWFQDIAAGSTSKGIRAPGNISVVPDFGYQTGWWTLPRGRPQYALGDDGAFTALGTYDQTIYVIPGLNATIAYQSSFPKHYSNLFLYGQQFATAIALALKK